MSRAASQGIQVAPRAQLLPSCSPLALQFLTRTAPQPHQHFPALQRQHSPALPSPRPLTLGLFLSAGYMKMPPYSRVRCTSATMEPTYLQGPRAGQMGCRSVGSWGMGQCHRTAL